MNREKPYLALLHRELHMHDALQNYGSHLEATREVVDYGTNLIVSAFNSSERRLSDVVLIVVLLKQVVSMLDALEVLHSNACTPAAALQSRAMFEASVYMDFILLGNEEEKAQCFYVSNLRTDLLWATRTRTGDPGAEEFLRSLGEFGESFRATEAEHRVELDRQAAEISDFLSKEPWSAVNKKLQSTRGKKKYEVHWYVPFGHGSVRDLCKRLGRLHEYEVFYSAFSERMHSSDYKAHMSIGKGFVTFEPIRNLSDAHSVLNYSLSIAFHTYRAILGRYRPGQLAEFAQRYKENWRELYLNIPTVTYAPKVQSHI